MRLVAVVAACLLAGCTFVHQREFLVQPVHELTAAETKAVFLSFQSFLKSKGLTPLPHSTGPNQVAYQIAGSQAGFILRRDWEDVLELSYEGGTTFRLHLVRIVHQPGGDFTEENLRRFVEQCEVFIREASSTPVRLILVQKNDP